MPSTPTATPTKRSPMWSGCARSAPTRSCSSSRWGRSRRRRAWRRSASSASGCSRSSGRATVSAMPLSPAARTMLDQLKQMDTPPLWQQDITAVRERDRMMLGALDQQVDVKSVENRSIPGPTGDLPVRIYTPDVDAPRPLIVYFHGGGFVFCSIDTHDGTCRRLANATGAVVVSVEYRLAPECPFPAAPDDCYAATVWTHEYAEELGADTSQLVVAGDSAGGNLAAVVAQMARERGAPPIAFQV